MRSNSAGSVGSRYNGYATNRPAILGIAKLLFLALCQVCHVSAAPLAELVGITRRGDDVPKDAEDPSLWLYLVVASILVLLGGAFAGLTIA
jgi:metal transporter CNNM